MQTTLRTSDSLQSHHVSNIGRVFNNQRIEVSIKAPIVPHFQTSTVEPLEVFEHGSTFPVIDTTTTFPGHIVTSSPRERNPSIIFGGFDEPVRVPNQNLDPNNEQTPFLSHQTVFFQEAASKQKFSMAASNGGNFENLANFPQLIENGPVKSNFSFSRLNPKIRKPVIDNHVTESVQPSGQQQIVMHQNTAHHHNSQKPSLLIPGPIQGPVTTKQSKQIHFHVSPIENNEKRVDFRVNSNQKHNLQSKNLQKTAVRTFHSLPLQIQQQLRKLNGGKQASKMAVGPKLQTTSNIQQSQKIVAAHNSQLNKPFLQHEKKNDQPQLKLKQHIHVDNLQHQLKSGQNSNQHHLLQNQQLSQQTPQQNQPILQQNNQIPQQSQQNQHRNHQIPQQSLQIPQQSLQIPQQSLQIPQQSLQIPQQNHQNQQQNQQIQKQQHQITQQQNQQISQQSHQIPQQIHNSLHQHHIQNTPVVLLDEQLIGQQSQTSFHPNQHRTIVNTPMVILDEELVSQQSQPAEQTQIINELSTDDDLSNQPTSDDPDGDGITGIAGINYPTFSHIFKTSFQCKDKPTLPGTYADMEAKCQSKRSDFNNGFIVKSRPMGGKLH
uniref:Uncharacterized protein n=1 Tax=Strigamia maritima TaxID=126957 RepID=T1JL41_STRMM